ncbi:MAG: hypothetical protein IJC51_03520 [Eggerthellaceae bacterium]|nr:hypothetical protein [Eggerthellaceae bacterium]
MVENALVHERRQELWDRDRIKAEQLPSLHDLLCTCDPEMLCRVLVEDFAGCASSRGHVWIEAPHETEARIRAALDVMCSFEVSEDEGVRLFLPVETFELDSEQECVLRYVDAALVDMSKMPQVKRARAKLMQSISDCGEAEQDYGWLSEADLGVSGVKTCADLPWETVLATKVWIQRGLCRRERYLMLASIFWEMTRRGLHYPVSGLSGYGALDATSDLVAGWPSVCSEAGREEEGDWLDEVWLLDPYGLLEPDYFDEEYRTKLRSLLAAANRRSFLALLDCQLDVARRLGVAA